MFTYLVISWYLQVMHDLDVRIKTLDGRNLGINPKKLKYLKLLIFNDSPESVASGQKDGPHVHMVIHYLMGLGPN